MRGALRQIQHRVGPEHHRLLLRGCGAAAHRPGHPGAHTHRQGGAIQQLLVIALAAEVVEVLVRQPQVRQFPFPKGGAMAGVPDRR
ncbi:hypothetical protein [Synechococcus sp. A15-44]|uniref:hypothetical protein n=1 Tax=Synechococcus sp. A15-44 TaxID=1050646 RepID=UPI001645D83B|nr:hypothetical protein [Synechococcus sp. A15-44]